MTTLLRSRQPRSGSPNNVSLDPSSLATVSQQNDRDTHGSKGNTTKSLFHRYRILIALIISIVFWNFIFANQDSQTSSILPQETTKAPMGDIIYGSQSKGEDTARLVKEAIQTGFRHIATGGFHFGYNEAGVGQGWKESGVPRNQLYLQTLFLSQSTENYNAQNCHLDAVCPPLPGLSIEEQVKLSILSSLHNLQTDYIDAVLIHNFRAKLQPYEETLQAWRVLEDYVDKGVIRHLGIVSVHDKEYLTKLHADARIKPTIIQNRFHSNRNYDISLRPVFRELDFQQNQLFWILTGSAGGKVRNDSAVKQLADKKGVSPQVLLYSLTMKLGGAPLIGCKSIDHMKQDVDALLNNKLTWESDELVTMAGVVNKNLIKQ